jgi:hypothetical protein
MAASPAIFRPGPSSCSDLIAPPAALRGQGCGRRADILAMRSAASTAAIAAGALAIGRRRWLLLAAAVLAAAAAVHAGRAEPGGARADIAVSVRVPAMAVIRSAQHPPHLAVTEADVARGWVDVAGVSRLTIATTSHAGYLLEFLPRTSVFRSAEVRSGGAPVAFGTDGGAVATRGRPAGVIETEIAYRFELAAGVRPGIHPWPLAIAVRPL